MVDKVFTHNQHVVIDGAPGTTLNGSVPLAPSSVESFSHLINESIESASNPKSETSFRGFVGAVVRVAKEGMYKFNVE